MTSSSTDMSCVIFPSPLVNLYLLCRAKARAGHRRAVYLEGIIGKVRRGEKRREEEACILGVIRCFTVALTN